MSRGKYTRPRKDTYGESFARLQRSCLPRLKAVGFLGATPVKVMPDMDFYGGDRGRAFDATGYFRLEQIDKRWWLVDPDGNGWGIKGPWDEPYADFVKPVRDFNRGIYERLRE